MEAAPAPAGPGTIVLDIGGEMGAVVLTASPRRLGQEIEICEAGGDWTGRHVAFYHRSSGAGTAVVAVFPRVAAGDWRLRILGDETSPVVSVDVPAGRVTSATYPDEGDPLT